MRIARQFVRFALVGGVATAIHAVVFALAIEWTPLDPVAATVIAFSVAFVAGFALNRGWTFGSRGNPLRQSTRYLGVQLVGLGLNAAIMAFAVHVQHWSPYVGLALSILLVPPVTFTLSRTWAFRQA